MVTIASTTWQRATTRKISGSDGLRNRRYRFLRGLMIVAVPGDQLPAVPEDRLPAVPEPVAIGKGAFLATAGVEVRSRGLYICWVDAAGATDFESRSGPPSGRRTGLCRACGRDPLEERAKVEQHALGSNQDDAPWWEARVLDLPLSLGSILAEADGAGEIDEPALTAWMHEHLRR